MNAPEKIYIKSDSTSINYTFSKEIDWLKSLKDRLK